MVQFTCKSMHSTDTTERTVMLNGLETLAPALRDNYPNEISEPSLSECAICSSNPSGSNWVNGTHTIDIMEATLKE